MTSGEPAGSGDREHGEYLISTDPQRLDLEAIHRWLAEESYWADGRTRATVETSVANSINFGAYDRQARLAGYARVVTDRVTFAWLCDVFVLEEHRGRGLGVALVDAVMSHPDLQGIKRFALATADAHELYRRFGFDGLDRPERWMMKRGETA